jgi:hypothetical protein
LSPAKEGSFSANRNRRPLIQNETAGETKRPLIFRVQGRVWVFSLQRSLSELNRDENPQIAHRAGRWCKVENKPISPSNGRLYENPSIEISSKGYRVRRSIMLGPGVC